MPKIFFTLLILGVLFNHSASAGTESRPAIIWASSPVAPDETVMLQTGNISKEAIIQLAPLIDEVAGNAKPFPGSGKLKWTTVEILQRSESTLKFVVPATWKMGIFACRILDGQVSSDIFYLNAPHCWWFQGDQGKTATPGGWLRLAGNCLNIGNHKSAVQLVDSSGKSVDVPLDSAHQFDLKAILPVTLSTGLYDVWLHNGAGGKVTWHSCGKLNIRKEEVWPTNIFNVKTLGLETALKQAEANKGGIIYFPRGEYHLSDSIEVPDHTILRGESKELVSLYWLDQEKLQKSMIHGQKFAIEDLTLYCQYHFMAFIRIDQGEFRMTRVRMRANHMYMLGRAKGEVPFHGRQLKMEPREESTALYLNALKSFSITDCEILAGSMGMTIWNSNYGIFRNNHVQFGRRAFTCECSNQLIIERNNLEGHDMAATGNDFATFFGNSEENVLFKENRFANAYGLDRELLTFDATGGAYFGRIATVSGKKMVLAKDPLFKRYAQNSPNWVNTAVCILKGKGIGQYRRVVKHSGRDWEVDEPWKIDPDETSILSIVPFRGRTLILDNTFEDGGAMQLYGMSIENIVSGNKGMRMSGFFAWGLNARLWGWQPTWYNQFLNTQILEGNNYSHTPALIGIWGNVETLDEVKNNSNKPEKERTVFEEIWNHFEITPQMADLSLARCIVVRNNLFRSNGKILINGNTSDVVIEKNAISKSGIGIQLDKKPDCLYLRLNRFENVDQPVAGEGKNKAVILSK
jgi:hypothetical protein